MREAYQMHFTRRLYEYFKYFRPPTPPTHEKSRKPRENVNELRMRWAQIRRRFFYFFWDTAYLYRKVFYKSGQWDGRILGLLRPTYVSYNPLGPASGCQLRTSESEDRRPRDPQTPGPHSIRFRVAWADLTLVTSKEWNKKKKHDGRKELIHLQSSQKIQKTKKLLTLRLSHFEITKCLP